MMRRTILSAVLFAAAAAGGCYTSGSVGYTAGYSSPSGEAYVATPDLVEVSPGVQVVADYDEPVFFSDGFYWRFYDGGWYRSNNYAAGWIYYERPPVAVLRIERPTTYVHYRPQGYVVRNRARYRPAEPVYRGARPVERDHRASEPVYQQGRPVERDHRAPEPVYQQGRPVERDHRAPEPVYQQGRPVERDHRQAEPVSRPPTPAPAPVVRDHRRNETKENDRDHRH